MTFTDLTALLPIVVLATTSVALMLVIALRRSHALTAGVALAGLGAAFVSIFGAWPAAPRQVTPLLVMDGPDRLPDDRELPTEPDRGIVYRPGLLPIVLCDPDAEPARLDELDGEVAGLPYLDELDPGTTTGLDPPFLSAPVLGVTSGRDVCDEPTASAPDVAPPLVLYNVGR